MYMHHYGAGEGWFLNLPLWSVPLLGAFMVFALWSVVWKGLALWHAGRNGQPWWFVIILIVNTLGILEIIYLFFVLKLKFNQLFTSGGHSHPHDHPHHGHDH